MSVAAAAVSVDPISLVEYVKVHVAVAPVSRPSVSDEDFVAVPLLWNLPLVSHLFYDYTVSPPGLLLVKYHFQNRCPHFESDSLYRDFDSTLVEGQCLATVPRAS